MGVVTGEKLGWGNHRKSLLVVSRFTKKIIEEDGALVPPVAVEFGVVGAEDDGFGTHDPAKVLDLFFAIKHKVCRMFGCALAGKVGSVRLFVRRATGDAVVFQAGEFSHSVRLDVGADVIVIEIEAAISVEVAVLPISGVPLLCTPDLFAGFDIATKGGRTCGGEDGGKDSVSGAGLGIEDSMCVHDEPADFGLLEVMFDPWVVGALWEPDPARVSAKAGTIIGAGDLDLGADGLREFAHERQKTVGGTAGDDFQKSCILKFTECLDEVALVAIAEKVAAMVKTIVIEAGEGLEGGIVLGSVKLFSG